LQAALGNIGHQPAGHGLEEVVERVHRQHPKRDAAQSGRILAGDEGIDGYADQEVRRRARGALRCLKSYPVYSFDFCSEIG